MINQSVVESTEKACQKHLNDLQDKDHKIDFFNSDVVVRMHYAMYLKSSLLDGPIDDTFARGRPGGNGQGTMVYHFTCVGFAEP